MIRGRIMIRSSGRGVVLSMTLAACASAPRPDGPPPEYERGPSTLDGPAGPEATAEVAAPEASTTPTASPTAVPAPTASAPAAPTSPAPDPSADAASSTPPAPALSVPNANLSVGSITADGFTMKDLACRVDGGGGLGGLLLAPAIAAGLSKKKAALDACARKGADVRVRFTTSNGKISQAEADAGDPKVEACVAKALKGVVGIADGTCAATFHVGR